MSTLWQCDRCGRQSSDPRTENWVRHMVTKQLPYGPINVSDDLARSDDLCHPCRERYEDWFNHPTDEELP